ncbi:MAG: hypothetical protein A3G93_10000 [Nitrospinae bacterium RIFCSPLOWO2_12_FULL_45_22]|nr:MAG: hypothetical protein A3G93_10000 [Nitrospinae bacterium RIFCSPLOWO2_12_FULL_45_22]
MPGSLRDKEYKVDILAFKAGKACFGVELKQILRVHRYAPEEVFKVRNNVAEVITTLTRDKVEFPLIGFNEILGLADQKRETEGRATIIVVKSDDGPIGIIVDEVEEFYSLSPRELYPLPQRIRRLLPLTYIWGLGLISDRPLLLIETNNLPGIRDKNLINWTQLSTKADQLEPNLIPKRL